MSFAPDNRQGLLHVPAGTGLTKWVSGDIYTMKSTKAETCGSLGFVEAIVPPGSGPIAHAHTDEDEAFYILDGELEFLDGDRTFVGRQGDFVFIPRHRRHRFKNITEVPTKTLFLFTPAGPEDLFIEGGDDPRPGEQPVPWDMARVEQVMDIVQRTGLVVLPETP
ncbi:cupin domain-containing protein [Dactylosporangium sp. CA-092794]|uniref:cupin domain-containing protein n=1 Tax=Dactylosporangium sp. CA-092794 TaxID=3239929 RepID=UPI003D94D6DE